MEIKLLTIKEYAKKKNITYEAVRKQIQKYKDDELKDHIIKKNKTQFLDEYAVNFLDNRRRESPVLLYQMEKDEEIEALKRERENLLIKIATQADKIAQQADELREADKALKDVDRLLLSAKEDKERAEALAAQNAVLSHDNEELGQKIAETAKTVQKASQELLDARKQFEDEKHLMQQEIEQLRNRKWWKLLFKR